MLPGLHLALETDAGVFSAGRLDAGTRLLLDTVPAPPPAGHLLDLGCGYGPLALVLAARSPRATVWAVDVNTFPGYKGVPHPAARIARYIEDFASGRLTLVAPGGEAFAAGPRHARHPAGAKSDAPTTHLGLGTKSARPSDALQTGSRARGTPWGRWQDEKRTTREPSTG